jgi:hypothetical protein
MLFGVASFADTDGDLSSSDPRPVSAKIGDSKFLKYRDVLAV